MKKILSLLLALCMVMSMFPAIALADNLEWGVVRVYSYYSDIGFVWGYAGSDPIGAPETEIAEEKDGYTFQGWYRVTARDDDGLATAYGELLCSAPTYNYTMEEEIAMVAVYERTSMSPSALKLTAHYQDQGGNAIREDGDVQFGDFSVENYDVAPTIDGHKYLYEQIAGGASGYTFYHVKKDAADSPWNPSYYGITGDGQSVILTEPVEIIYYYYVPNSPAGYPTAYYQAEDGKELHASETLSLDEDGGIWLTEPVGEHGSYKVLAPSIDGYTIKEIRVADGQGFTNLADTEHGLHLKGWDDYYGEWVFHSSEGEVTAAHGTPTFTYVYTSNAQTSGFTIDETNFPDSEFRRYVSEHFDSDGSGTLSESEIAVASVIDFGGHGDNPWVKEYNISSLAGIEYFTALVELNCSYSNVSSLSLNNNQNLRILNCAQCHDLSSLDLSGNTQLEELICWYDFGLNTLDLSHNPMLRVLECYGNGISSLDISHNPVLAALSCGQNSFTSLDFNGSSSLRTLNCTDCASLVSLNLSNCTALNTVECENCALTSLNINGCLSLEKLFCENNQLTSLSTQGCANLIWLDCSDNTLTTLDVSGAPLLKILDCESNPLSGLDVRQNTALEVLLVDGCGLATLDLSQNAALVRLNAIDNTLSSLDISGNLSLKVLECAMSPLTTLDISANATLKSVYATGVTDQAGDMANFYLAAPTGTDDELGANPTQNHRNNIYYTTGPAGGNYYAEALCVSPAVEVITESQMPHEHSWDDGVVQKAATTEEPGIMLYSCTVCGETKTEEIPKLEQEVLSGKCGDNLTYTLVNGILTISGTGEMWNYSSKYRPGWENATKAILMPGVTTIGDYAFANFTTLLSVSLPDGLTCIGKNAFRGCDNLYDINFQESITEIGEWSFSGTFLPNIDLPSNRHIELPSSLESIGKCAFCGSGLESIVIPDKIIEIPYGAFSECAHLSSIILPQNLTIVGEEAFSQCNSLLSVKLPNSVLSVGKRAFWFCTNLNSVILSQSLTQISSGMFSECWSLSHIDLPAGLTDIESSAFSNCHALTEITIPAEVDGIAEGAFISCTNLESINVNDGNVSYYSVDGILFNDNVLVCYPARKSGATYAIPQNVNIIASAAFNSTCNLQTVDIPSYVREIGRSAFVDSSIRSISIPDSITEIKYCTFWNCQELNRIALPASIVTIIQDAFRNCVSLSDVYYVGSEREWNEITIENNNGYLTSATIHYNSTKPESEIRSGVCGDNLTWNLDDEGILTISGEGRMYDYSDVVDGCAPWFPVKDQIKKVVLGEGVLSIGDYAFDRCENLSSVNSPDNLTSIGRGAFNRCTNLRSIGFKTGLAEIGIGAFSDCSKLVWIALPDDLIAIMDSAFFNCDRLTDVYFASSEVKWNEIVIRPGNDRLNIAKIHYESYGPEPTRLDILLQGSSVEYNRELATIAAELSLATYEVSSSDSGVVKYLKEFGFSPLHIYSNNYAGSLAYTVATKPYFGDDADSNTDILIVVAQGSTSPYEFIQDAVSVLGESINGYQAYNIVIDFYKDIFAGIDKLVQPGREYKVLITGHSLGGAAANIVAAKLTTSYYGKANVYCYTFGAIDSIKVDCPVSYGYENIHNVYNKLDTFSPFQRGKNLLSGMGSMYGKFGHLDLFIHDYRTAEEAHYTAIDDMLAHVNHDMDKYLNAVQNGEIEAFRARLGKQYTVCACPVNVEVYKNGELVGRVLNNAVDASVTTIDIVTVSGVKFIYYPDDAQYELRINAFDEGSMLFQTYDPSSGMVKTISDVQLYPGKEMYSRIGGEVEVPQISLYVLGGNDTPIREVHEDGTETAITHIHEWDGGVITTAPTCTEDGVRTYTCTICGETKAEALPSIDHSWDAGTVTKAATCTETGVMTYTCKTCGVHGTAEIPPLGHSFEGGVCKICGEAQPGFAPKIIEGNGGTAHYGSDYVLKSDAAFSTFLTVYMDGVELSPTSYTAKEGSTIVILKGSYISTLAEGTHTIRIASTVGNADGRFTISKSPKTGDSNDYARLVVLSTFSFLGMSLLYVCAKKHRRRA